MTTTNSLYKKINSKRRQKLFDNLEAYRREHGFTDCTIEKINEEIRVTIGNAVVILDIKDPFEI